MTQAGDMTALQYLAENGLAVRPDAVSISHNEARAIENALDTIGLALVERGHSWTKRERRLWERARAIASKFSSTMNERDT